jgi:hypothetical protein
MLLLFPGTSQWVRFLSVFLRLLAVFYFRGKSTKKGPRFPYLSCPDRQIERGWMLEIKKA